MNLRSSNDSSTGGTLVQTDRGVTLTDSQLEDLIHDWIAALTQLDSALVRPAWQPDPPPIPDFTCPCWCAFSVMNVVNDWDPVVRHWPVVEQMGWGEADWGVSPYGGTYEDGKGVAVCASGPSQVCSTVFRSQQIELLLTFYGRNAGDSALDFRQATGIRQNEEMLDPSVKLVEVQNQVTTSEQIKGRWQRRVDVPVILRRAVEFTYGVTDIGGTYGTIYSDAPAHQIDWSVTEGEPVTEGESDGNRDSSTSD